MQYAEEIFKEFTPEITTYMVPKSAKDISETKKFIKDSIETMNAWNNYQTVILDKATKEILGCAWLHLDNTKAPELGIRIKKSAFGKKIGKEAVTGLTDRAQKNLDFEYLFYPVDRDNISSRKIAESLWWIVQKDNDGNEKITNHQTVDPNSEIHWVEYKIYKKILLPTWLSMTNTISEAEYDHMIHTMEANDLSRYNITKEDFTVIKNEKNEIVSFGRSFEIWPKQREVWSLRVDETYRGQKLWLLIFQELIKNNAWENDLYLATKKELGQYYEKIWFEIITKNIPEKLVHTGIWAKENGIDFIIMKLK